MDGYTHDMADSNRIKKAPVSGGFFYLLIRYRNATTKEPTLIDKKDRQGSITRLLDSNRKNLKGLCSKLYSRPFHRELLNNTLTQIAKVRFGKRLAKG